MNEDTYIGKGNLANKGVYANKNFKKGDIIVKYHLKQLTKEELENLSDSERMFVHIHSNKSYLYSIPERYVNHSDIPNTYQDIENGFDIALCDIRKNEMITTNSTKDDV